MNKKLKLLFLCTGNSCRSQMAEGWARHLKGDHIEAFSAGIETHGLNPNMVKVMAEAGVDVTSTKNQKIFATLRIHSSMWWLPFVGMLTKPVLSFPQIVRWYTVDFRIPRRWQRNWLNKVHLKRLNWIVIEKFAMKSKSISLHYPNLWRRNNLLK